MRNLVIRNVVIAAYLPQLPDGARRDLTRALFTS